MEHRSSPAAAPRGGHSGVPVLAEGEANARGWVAALGTATSAGDISQEATKPRSSL